MSANHLALVVLAFDAPPSLHRRRYDPAGHAASARLVARARAERVDALLLAPVRDDWNADLKAVGGGAVLVHLLPQLAAEDAMRFRQTFRVERIGTALRWREGDRGSIREPVGLRGAQPDGL